MTTEECTQFAQIVDKLGPRDFVGLVFAHIAMKAVLCTNDEEREVWNVLLKGWWDTGDEIKRITSEQKNDLTDKRGVARAPFVKLPIHLCPSEWED